LTTSARSWSSLRMIRVSSRAAAGNGFMLPTAPRRETLSSVFCTRARTLGSNEDAAGIAARRSKRRARPWYQHIGSIFRPLGESERDTSPGQRGLSPHSQKGRLGPPAARIIILCLAGALGVPSAAAQPPVTPKESLESSADLDGFIAAAGPLGSAVYLDGEWAGAFGAEVTVVRVNEGSRLQAVGASLGGTRFAGRDAGLLWLDLTAATHGPLGVPVGAAVGANLRLDELARPRPGVQGTIWLFLGVVPFVRAGWVDGSGTLVEAGLKIALPVIRWK